MICVGIVQTESAEAFSVRLTPQEQHDAIRQKWIAVRYEFGVRFTDILFWILVTLCGAGLMPGIFYRRNCKLKQENQERKRAEQEKELLIHDLRKALNESETLQGTLAALLILQKNPG